MRAMNAVLISSVRFPRAFDPSRAATGRRMRSRMRHGRVAMPISWPRSHAGGGVRAVAGRTAEAAGAAEAEAEGDDEGGTAAAADRARLMKGARGGGSAAAVCGAEGTRGRGVAAAGLPLAADDDDAGWARAWPESGRLPPPMDKLKSGSSLESSKRDDPGEADEAAAEGLNGAKTLAREGGMVTGRGGKSATCWPV